MARCTAIQRHAIAAPVFERGNLHGRRLEETLKANQERRLVTVVGPAGSGKTVDFGSLTGRFRRAAT